MLLFLLIVLFIDLISTNLRIILDLILMLLSSTSSPSSLSNNCKLFRILILFEYISLECTLNKTSYDSKRS